MFRPFLASLLLLGLAGQLPADELKGSFSGFNAETNTITVTIDSKEQTYPVSKDATVVTDDAKAKAVNGGLQMVKVGSAITIMVEKQGDKDVVTLVKVATKEKKAKKEKDDKKRKREEKQKKKMMKS